MKDSSPILFKFLLLIYPPFVLWSQGGMLLINQIIGGAIGLIIACIWLLKKGCHQLRTLEMLWLLE